MISRGAEISIAGGGGEMVRVLSLGRFFPFFFFLFFIQIVIMLKGRKDSCSARYGDRKTYKQTSSRPLHLVIGKIKHPESIGQVSPA